MNPRNPPATEPETPKEKHGWRRMRLSELITVLLVLVLLAGGLIKTRDMFTNAAIRDLQVEFALAENAVRVYRDRFGFYPGDDPGASDRWDLVHEVGNGNGRIEGRWNEPLDASAESRLAWHHLRNAKLVRGAKTGTGSSRLRGHTYGGVIGLTSNFADLRGNVLCMSRLPVHVAEQIDEQLDNGLLHSGLMRGLPGTVVDSTGLAASRDDEITVCRRISSAFAEAGLTAAGTGSSR